ncbi:MAG: STAS domain-containing protein [Chthoniobacterales bacterium]|nr:STAS domain-containing protein [Chthoniobacterales bacterium]
MKISWSEESGIGVARLEGRLDGHGSKEAAQVFADAPFHDRVILDCSDLSYLSSAGVRVLLGLLKSIAARGGALAVANLQPFCASVLEMSGLSGLIAVFGTVQDAVGGLRDSGGGAGGVRETAETKHGRFAFYRVGTGAGTIDILGDIANVIDCAITEQLVAGKPFFETEYSLGLGALGATPADYLPVMGEALMVAGTMVWLPTDGNDTPDYMIPRKASTEVVLQTGFNASLRGGFNEFVEFNAPEGRPATVRDIYRSFFDLARERRADFRGVLGIAMRAEIHEAFGAGVTKSPLLSNRPSNGKPITDPSNFPHWFESDKTPRNQGTTALICGAGEDLTADRSGIDEACLRRMFYVNPANKGTQTEVLHNHAVFFRGAPPPGGTHDVDVEMRRVVESGEFVDMRHLLDQTTVTSALVAVSYIQEVREDTNR